MYKKSTSSWIKHIDFTVLDILCLEAAFLISFLIRHGVHQKITSTLYSNAAIIIVMIDVIVVFFFESYKGILWRGPYSEFMQTMKHSTSITALLVGYLYITQQAFLYSRTVFILTWLIDVLLSYTVRQIWKVIIKNVIKSDKTNSRSLLILTTEKEADQITRDIINKNFGKFIIKGICIVDKVCNIGDQIEGVDIVANYNDVLDYICKNWVDEVFISCDRTCQREEEYLVTNCMVMGVTVHQNLFKVLDISNSNQVVDYLGGYTVLTQSVKIFSLKQLFLKRFVDIIGGFVGLIITGFLFLFIAPIIYLKSPGPIFFKQERVGKNGKKFKIIKFRSMYPDAEQRKKELMNQNEVKDGMMFKIDNDPRIIGGENGKGIGNFIRNTSIDEFPQFLNVLKGDMSLVGTRPPTIDEWEKYSLHHRKRMAMKPGLTGLWQVSGRSDITDFEEVVKLDTKYITEWSFEKDLMILVKTIGVIFTGKGAR